MNKVYFVFGNFVHSWSEWGSNNCFDLKNILEITHDEPVAILKDTKDKLLAAIENKEIEKRLQYGGEGDLGGSYHKFHGEFFTKDVSKKELVRELNFGLQNILGEIFILPKV